MGLLHISLTTRRATGNFLNRDLQDTQVKHGSRHSSRKKCSKIAQQQDMS